MSVGKVQNSPSSVLSQVSSSPAPVSSAVVQGPAVAQSTAPVAQEKPGQVHGFESKQEQLQQQQKLGVLEKSTQAPASKAADPALAQQLRQGLIASRSQPTQMPGGVVSPQAPVLLLELDTSQSAAAPRSSGSRSFQPLPGGVVSPQAPVLLLELDTSQGKPAQGFGKGMIEAGAAEKAVKARSDEDKPMNLFGTQAERTENLKRLTQVDGDMKTRMDEQTCGVHCIVAGLYHQKPEALTQIASKMLENPNLEQLAISTGGNLKDAKAALTAIKEGKASPVQIATMSQLLTMELKSDGKSGQSVAKGTSAEGLQYLTDKILKDKYGVEVPPMRLNRVDNGGENHWIAQYPTSTQADTVDGAKKDHLITFDPWPRKDGYAGVGTAISTKDADLQQTAPSDVKLLNSLNIGGSRATI